MTRSSKYGAVRTNGFASKKEAARYQELCLLQKAGEIKGLVCQRGYELEVNGQFICKYRCDFEYLDRNGKLVVEDVKGFKTPVYQLKKKLMKACFGIEIKET